MKKNKSLFNLYFINCVGKAKTNNLLFRATVLKTLGRVGSVIFFLRIETSIIKTPTKKNGIFVRKV